MRSSTTVEEPDYTAPLPDEESEAEPDATATEGWQPRSRELMEWAEENAERLGSHEYVRLADIAGDLASLERKYKRLEKRIIEYDGEDASVLAPSGGSQIDANDYLSDDDASECSSNASSSLNSQKSTAPSTKSSEAGELIVNSERSRKAKAETPSNYFLKYMGRYYIVPLSAILRNYKAPPFEVRDAETLHEMCTRGKRTRTWRNQDVATHDIVVLKMLDRKNEERFYWCITLAVKNTQHADDRRILHMLPELTARRLQEKWAQHDVHKTSQLVKDYRPAPYPDRIRSGCAMLPIPGKTRVFDLPCGEDHVEYGNYWRTRKMARKLKSSVA